jgi:hypothetical protein
MKRVLALGVFAAAAVVLPAWPAVAVTPPGQGLASLTIQCAEGQTLEVVVPHGDPPTAFVSGEHLIVLSFTFATAEGTFTDTFGQKTGLATTTVTCTFTPPDEPTATVTVVAVPVPPEG